MQVRRGSCPASGVHPAIESLRRNQLFRWQDPRRHRTGQHVRDRSNTAIDVSGEPHVGSGPPGMYSTHARPTSVGRPWAIQASSMAISCQESAASPGQTSTSLFVWLSLPAQGRAVLQSATLTCRRVRGLRLHRDGDQLISYVTSPPYPVRSTLDARFPFTASCECTSQQPINHMVFSAQTTRLRTLTASQHQASCGHAAVCHASQAPIQASTLRARDTVGPSTDTDRTVCM